MTADKMPVVKNPVDEMTCCLLEQESGEKVFEKWLKK